MDKIDRIIISQLQKNGRTTLQELARMTGYTSMGVKKRLSKLIENDVIKTSALLNIESLKLSAAIVMLEMESAEAMQVLLDRFRECPRVVHVFKTLGGYNLIVLLVAEDKDTLESESIEKCSIRSGSGIRRSEFYLIGQMHYSPFLNVREHLTHKNRTLTPCGVDCRPCSRFKIGKCVGCPAVRYYTGHL